jgi:hypothetical protein
MRAKKFQFTAATAAAATAVPNTVKLLVDYLNSNHCQNDKNHLISINTAVTEPATIARVAH